MESEQTIRARRVSAQPSRLFQSFFQSEASGSVMLLIAAIIALVWANSAWSAAYVKLLHAEISIALGQATFTMTLHEFVNDGLMAIFFLVVGLEIKREIVVGELSTRDKAILPVAAALGGMAVPALIYIVLNPHGEAAQGWAAPMATDIAFALGILALLGSRVPLGLKVFLTALAIVDDLGSILVIAIFYSSGINVPALLVAAVFLLLVVAVGRAQVRRMEVYIILALGVWLAIYASGLHATLAGILLAMTIPVTARMDPEEFLRRGYANLKEIEGSRLTVDSMIHNREQLERIMDLHLLASRMRPAGLVVEEYLHPVVAYLILPIFALFNAGVVLSTAYLTDPLTRPVVLGMVLGLVVGKQVGIMGATWLAARLTHARLAEGVTWKQLYGMAWLGGIGFTMSFFIDELAFSDEAYLSAAKIGILIASVIAGSAGYLILRKTLPGR